MMADFVHFQYGRVTGRLHVSRAEFLPKIQEVFSHIVAGDSNDADIGALGNLFALPPGNDFERAILLRALHASLHLPGKGQKMRIDYLRNGDVSVLVVPARLGATPFEACRISNSSVNTL
eukprot:m.98909 g.98909  ORF g.98909 m.98909 type:complete len:120 (+) comp8706_c0_seq1:74-433(+)